MVAQKATIYSNNIYTYNMAISSVIPAFYAALPLGGRITHLTPFVRSSRPCKLVTYKRKIVKKNYNLVHRVSMTTVTGRAIFDQRSRSLEKVGFTMLKDEIHHN